MGEKERIEEQIRRAGGPYADRIIKMVRQIAEIDVKIKSDLDEIERVDDGLVRKHNDLADRINDLIRKSVNEAGCSESDEGIVSPGEEERECAGRMRLEIQLID